MCKRITIWKSTFPNAYQTIRKNYTLDILTGEKSLFIDFCNTVWNNNIPFFSDAIAKFNDIMSPVYYGLIFAYIANPLMVFFEKRVLKFKKKERKVLKRTLSLIITYFLILSVIAAFFMLLLPQVISSYNDLYSKIETLIKNIIPEFEEFLNTLSVDYSEYPNLKELLTSNTITDTL